MVNITISVLQGSLVGTNIVVNFSTSDGTAKGQLVCMSQKSSTISKDLNILVQNNEHKLLLFNFLE